MPWKSDSQKLQKYMSRLQGKELQGEEFKEAINAVSSGMDLN
jgi:hypothetical protein